MAVRIEKYLQLANASESFIGREVIINGKSTKTLLWKGADTCGINQFVGKFFSKFHSSVSYLNLNLLLSIANN